MLLLQGLADGGAGASGGGPQAFDEKGRMADKMGFSGKRLEGCRRFEPLHHPGRREDRPDAGGNHRWDGGEGFYLLSGAGTHEELIARFDRFGNGENRLPKLWSEASKCH